MRSLSLPDLNLSSEEVKEIAKLLAQKRGIKDYEGMSKDELLSALKASENKTRTEKIREKIMELPHKFSRSEIKKIKRNFIG